MQPSNAVAAYRRLLKAVHANVGSATGNDAFRRFAAAEFRRLAEKGGSEEDVEKLVRLAEDYAFLSTSVKEHKELLFSYNIGIDPDVRAREGYRRAANRVGLELPKMD